MLSFKKLSLMLCLAFALLLGLAGPTDSVQGKVALDEPQEATTTPGDVVEHVVPTDEALAAESLWTEEARVKAQPAAWPEVDELSKDEGATATGPAGFLAGERPNADINALAPQQFPDAWEAIEEQGAEAPQMGTPGIFTRYTGNYYTSTWTSYPWSTIGKLYFTTPSGGSSYCTASAIARNVIVTAAHCTYTRGAGWNSNLVFVPADRYGAAPFGSFTANNYWVMNGWISDGGRRWDLSVVRLNTNGSGYHVGDYTGWMGRSWNYDYVQHLHAFGYASNLSTQYTHVCAAESYYGGSTDVIDMGCDMTYGSSGGPWIMNYGPFTGGYVNAVVSGPGTIFGTTFRGPRFSSDNIVPLCGVAGC